MQRAPTLIKGSGKPMALAVPAPHGVQSDKPGPPVPVLIRRTKTQGIAGRKAHQGVDVGIPGVIKMDVPIHRVSARHEFVFQKPPHQKDLGSQRPSPWQGDYEFSGKSRVRALEVRFDRVP